MIAFLFGGLAILPSAESIPVPPEFLSSLNSLLATLNGFNEIFPVDTLIKVAVANLIIISITRFTYPTILWLIKTVTGSRGS